MTSIYTVLAPLSGTIESMIVKSGSRVAKDDPLMILESMKVHVQIKSGAHGFVSKILVSEGDVIERGQPLIEIEESQSGNDKTLKPADVPQAEEEHSLNKEFQQRRTMSLDSHRQAAREKRHAKGYRTARENLYDLCEQDSFQEYGQFAVAAQRGRRDYETLKTETAGDGVITGIGRVNADFFTDDKNQITLIVNDYSVLAGTQGFFHHLKLDRILTIANRRNLPVIMFTEGGGGRPGDTDITTLATGLNCTSFSAWASMQQVPRIAVANGYNFAGNAALFGVADITIATKKSWIGMAGPAMIEGGGLGSFKATEIGPIEIQSQNGVVDIVADNEQHACKLAKQAIGFFQGSVEQWQAHDQSPLSSAMPENRKEIYDIRTIIERLADKKTLLEIKPEFGGAIVTAFIRLEGKPVGVIANDCKVLGGAVDAQASEKASDFIDLCRRFDIALVSLCDTPGFMVGPTHEELGAVRRVGKLFSTGSQHTAPFVAVILRKCYGLGAMAMVGGGLTNPDYSVSWPSGEFGAMGLEGAINLGYKKELNAQPSEEKRQALFDRLLKEAYRKGQALEIASTLEIDAVIDPAETRAIILQCLQGR